MNDGNGIVSGGALNVDFIALDEALKYNPKTERIKIFLPTTLKMYAQHYREHAQHDDITSTQAEDLIIQLETLKGINLQAPIEEPDENFTEENKKEKYYQRNSKVVEASDKLVAFRIRTNASEGLGTADTIEKTKQKGIPVEEHGYILKD